VAVVVLVAPMALVPAKVLMPVDHLVAMVASASAGVHQTFQDPQQYTELKPLQSMSQYLSLFTKTFWKIFTKTL
jgi:hypothetical protein